MKKSLTILVSIIVSFFPLGYVAVHFNLLDIRLYFTIATIAGSIASALGLLSLLRPAITANDLQSLEVQSLKKISEIAQEIENAKSQRTQTQEEINRLSEQKKEMALLVKKASLSLFLRDRIEKHQTQILAIVQANKELSDLIKEYDQLSEKLAALDEDIEADKNVKVLKEILRIARPSEYYKSPFDIFIRALLGVHSIR